MVRIAVIDDEPKIRRGITGMLEKSFEGRASVSSFKTVTELIKFARQYRIDILITDICMPDMDGLELGNYLKMFYPELRIIIISGYSNFEYAQAAITLQVCEYMLKPIDPEKLFDSVNRLVKMVEIHRFESMKEVTVSSDEKVDRNLLISALLYGNEQAISGLSKYLDLRQPYFLLICEDDENIYSSVMYGNSENLHQAVDKVSGLSGRLEGRKRFYLLTGDEAIEKVKKEILVHDICLRYALRAGISGRCYGASMLHLAYMQAISALKQEIYDETVGLWLFKGTGVWQFDGEKKALLLMNCILSKGSFSEELKSIEEEIRSARPVYPMFEKNVKTMLDSLVSLIEDHKVSAKYCMRLKEIAENIGACRSLNRLFDDIAKVLEKVLDSTKDMQSLREERHIRKALEYIQDNYCNDLTLEEVAAKADLNPAYFSSFFKKYTGSSLINYITELRIKKAKELLKEDKKISEISEMLGFNDTRYFAKIFKKYVGVTPSDYKNIAEKLYD